MSHESHAFLDNVSHTSQRSVETRDLAMHDKFTR